MDVKIEVEQSNEFSIVEDVVRRAFLTAPYTNDHEWLLVKQLRERPEHRKPFSLVAKTKEKIVGHVLLSTLQIHSTSKKIFQTLALAPLSVLPEFQGQGVGTKLIRKAHETALAEKFESIILLGDPDYYGRFGYLPASQWGIKAPFEVPDETFMAIELVKNSLVGCAGTVIYPPEFNS